MRLLPLTWRANDTTDTSMHLFKRLLDCGQNIKPFLLFFGLFYCKHFVFKCEDLVLQCNSSLFKVGKGINRGFRNHSQTGIEEGKNKGCSDGRREEGESYCQ